jgi:hypothetical protein
MLVTEDSCEDISTIFKQSIPRMIPKITSMDQLKNEIESIIILDKLFKKQMIKIFNNPGRN